MIIHSPIHSFVDFEGRLETFNLPVVDMYTPAFQLLFEAGTVDWNDVLKLQLVSADKSTVLADLDPAIGVINNTCSWCTIAGIPPFFGNHPLIVMENNVIPAGSYATKDDLINAFKAQGLNPDASPFLHCCDHGEVDHYDINTTLGGITVDFSKGLQYITFVTDVDNPNVFNAIAMNTCFRYCIYNQTQNVRVYSNLFVRKPDARHLMVVEYSSNEDSYDFHYPVGVQNVVYLPMKVRNPQYPEKRKVYKKSNQHYKVLSASIEKEYELITDYLPDIIHDRITVMLAHDNLFFTADNINNTVSKREGDDYSIDWPSDVIWHNEEPVGQGKGKISTPFEGRNSNCEKRPVCSFTPLTPSIPQCQPVGIAGTIMLPDATIGAPYNASVMLTGSTPFVLANFDGPAWMNASIVQDNVILSGTPLDGAGGTNVSVSMVITNCESSFVNYNDTIDVHSANAVHWDNDVEVTEDNPALQSWHNVQLTGQPGEQVTITVTGYTNNFGGVIQFNNAQVTAVNNTFRFTLDSSGNSGTIPVRLQGVTGVGHPYGMSAVFSITVSTSGRIGSPDIFQISKAFTS